MRYTIVTNPNASIVEETGALRLLEALRKRGHQAVLAKTPEQDTGDHRILLGRMIPDSPVARAAEGAGLQQKIGALGEEGYALCSASGSTFVTGPGDRSVIYAAYDLADRIERAGIVPEALDTFTSPHFKIRQWATHAFQGSAMRYPNTEGPFGRCMEEMEDYTNRIIDAAPFYGINELVLHGRKHEGVDTSWFITHNRFPKLEKALDKMIWDPQDMRQMIYERQRLLRRLGERAHAHGMTLHIWDHELVYPEELIQLYPEVRGEGDDICFSKPFIWEFLRGKYEELFEAVPELDGVVLTFFEVNYNILEAGCKCSKCSSYDRSRILADVVNCVNDVCRKHGKRVVARGAPADRAKDFAPEVIFQCKKGAGDFAGRDEPHRPDIAQLAGTRLFMTEFSLCVEQAALNHIPNLIMKDLRNRFDYHVERQVTGVSGRLDYQSFLIPRRDYGYKLIHSFDTPNDFNIHAFSRLAWNPKASMDDLLADWTERTYGRAAAPDMARILARTDDICHKALFTKGWHITMYTQDFGSLKAMHTNVERSWPSRIMVNHHPTLGKLHPRFLSPDEPFIQEVVAEKDEAVSMARQSVAEMPGLKDRMTPVQYRQMSDYLERELFVTLVWREIDEIFLRERICRIGKSDEGNRRLLLAALNRLLMLGYNIETRFGRDAYPVVSSNDHPEYHPSIYDFVEDCYELHFAKQYEEALAVWKAVVEMLRPYCSQSIRDLFAQLPGSVKTVTFKNASVIIFPHDGEPLVLPIGRGVTGDDLPGDRDVTFRIVRCEEDAVHVRMLSAEPIRVPKPAGVQVSNKKPETLSPGL